uniref:D-dopachrome decarboxylase n=1 Tax=Oncorhynchus kisutch TaxID=8019 RepID=A0A8C7MAN1_ONCKI
MPFIDLESNLPESTFSEKKKKKPCSKAAAVLGKPDERMMLVVKPGLPRLMGGTCAPCVILSVSAIGVTDTAEKNKEHVVNIFPFLTGELVFTEDRVVIRFYPLEAHQVGKERNCYELPVGGTFCTRNFPHLFHNSYLRREHTPAVDFPPLNWTSHTI